MTESGSSPRPDGGYGWIVVMSAFCVSLLVDGIKYSFGLMLPVLVDVFHQNTASVAAIGGTFLGSVALSSPFAGALSDEFSRRYVTIAGTLVFACGLFSSSFVSSMSLLYLTYGVLCGVGYGLMLGPSIAAVIEQFTHRRALAVGIAVAGSGTGTFVMNHLTSNLLEQYGWRGTFLIYSAIALNGAACGLTLPRKTTNRGRIPAIQPANQNGTVDQRTGQDRIPANLNRNCKTADEAAKQNRSMLDLETIQNCTMTYQCCMEHPRADIGHREHAPYTKDRSASNSTESSHVPTTSLCVFSKCDKLKHAVVTLFGITCVDLLSVLRDFQCLCIILSCVCYGFGFFVPFSFLPQQALSMGIAQHQVAWLTSSMGITNTLSRLAMGWVGTRAWVNKELLHICIMFLIAVSFSTSLLLTSFSGKLVFACVYGALFGSFTASVPVRLAGITSIKNVGKTMGLFYAVVNGANIVGMPLAGWSIDLTDAYDACYDKDVLNSDWTIDGWTIDVTGGYDVCYLLCGGEALFSVGFLLIPRLRNMCCHKRGSIIESTHF